MTSTNVHGARSSGAGEPSVLSGRAASLPAATFVDLVAEHASTRPDAPAVTGDGADQGYAELWRNASRMAAALAEAGVEAGDQVAVWATRTAPVVAAALGVMALGAAYIPIDPTYPAARVRRILEVGRPKVMVCADPNALAGSLPRGVTAVEIHAGPREPGALAPIARPDGVAYTVFTTGSTGLPKGVLVGHRALVNYLGWAQELTAFGPEDATPCFASLGFDHAVTCLWLPLMVGGSVQLVPDSWDPRPWIGPRDHPFAFVKITPSHVRLFERIARPDYRAITRTVMFGGERLDAALVAQLGERLSGVRLLNHYGPTEATVGCSAFEFDTGWSPEGAPDGDGATAPGTGGTVTGSTGTGGTGIAGGAPEGVVPIGTPVWNARAYVVDDALQPVPLGEEGELVLAGDCVATGYLGGAGEDEARFFEGARIDPGESARAYRTGDLCAVRGGQLHYLGRLDEQVKVGGYRIEIQEVRSLALSVGGVAHAAVAPAPTGAGGLTRLELFVVPEATAGDGLVTRVLERLRAELPSAAVPERVHVVPNLVVNAHGKWDAKATRELAEGIVRDAEAARRSGTPEATEGGRGS